jgi:hypothetical protein
MIDIISWYLSVGSSIYLIFFVRDAVEGFPRYKKAKLMDVVRGFGIPFVWPYLIFHMEIT